MNQKNLFQQLFGREKMIILDGGLATQLEKQGCDLNSELWSADLLLNDPQAIIDAHLAYLNAGAQIITTASYQASIQGFMSIGLSKERASEVILSSIALAEKAIEKFLTKNPLSPKPLIAASVGPYGAYLADGSEYKGDYGVGDGELKEFHAQRIAILDKSSADILACETIPCLQEAKVLASLLNNVETPAWVSFSCRDGRCLNDGTEIEKAVGLFKDHHRVFSLGVNCTAPEYVNEIIQRIKSTAPDKAIIVYPNSGEIYDAISKSWQSIIEPINFVVAAKAWKEEGAQMIGGCCRIGPELIKELANSFES